MTMTVMPTRGRLPRRVAMVSVHTSPLDQPGTGDAGGMNVYVVELSRRLAALGVEVDVITRATSSDLPPTVELAPGVTVRHVTAGPFEGLAKEDLPAQLCAFTSGLMRIEAARPPGWYDLVHSHYWLSGQVAWLAAERWDVPLVHTMHTMAKVKNLTLADGDDARAGRPGDRRGAGRRGRRPAGREHRRGGPPARRASTTPTPSGSPSVPPGVDLDLFSPGPRSAARRALGVADDAVPAAVRRPHPAAQGARRAAARGRPAGRAATRRCATGWSSRSSAARPAAAWPGPSRCSRWPPSSASADLVRFVPPVPQHAAADWYRAADLTVVPSYSESFGLVAIESQACGTPVVAAAVGGLRTAVADGVSGVLVDGPRPEGVRRGAGRPGPRPGAGARP